MLRLTQNGFDSDTEKGVLVVPTKEFQLQVKSGKVAWRRLDGGFTDSGHFRFLIDRNNRIFASDEKDENEAGCPTFPKRPRFHHASLVGNTWPKYAGRGSASKGHIILLANHTGHFSQPKSIFYAVFGVFERAGINVMRAKAAWYDGLIYSTRNPKVVAFRTAPLCGPDAPPWTGIHDDQDVARTSLSPSEYRASLLGL